MSQKSQQVPKIETNLDGVADIERLAEQAMLSGYYGLQDASLILAESLKDIQIELLPIVATWTDLVEKYPVNPKQISQVIINYLQCPEFNIAMAEDEFYILGLQLCNDAINDSSVNDDCKIEVQDVNKSQLKVELCQVEEKIKFVEILAEEAQKMSLFGLQDANFLLAEALREVASNVKVDSDFLCMISEWAELIEEYRKSPESEGPVIINFLRSPRLSIQMDDSEFAILQSQLIAEGLEKKLNDAGNYSDLPVSKAVPDTDSGDDVSSSLSSAVLELIELLLLESKEVHLHLKKIRIGDSESVLNGLQQAMDELERFVQASRIVGLEGLARICLHINLNMERFVSHQKIFSSVQLNLLIDWVSKLQEFLTAFYESDAQELVLSGLANEYWAQPMLEGQLAEIRLEIRSDCLKLIDQPEVTRKVTATVEDVSIDLPDDVNQELLELLLQELPIYTQQLSEVIQRMQSGGDEKDVEVAQRVAHTIKGSANTVGIKGIAVLTHHLEEILMVCDRNKKMPNQALANALITAADCLESMSEALLGVRNVSSDDAVVVLQDILDWANFIDQDWQLGMEDKRALSENKEIGPDFSEAIENSESSSSQVSVVRVSADQVESLFRLSGESIILNSQAHEVLRLMKKQLKSMQMQFNLLYQLGLELDQLIDLKDLKSLSNVSVSNGFDALEMDQYNELHTASRRMAEAAVDAREISLDVNKELAKMNEILDDQQSLVVDVQEVVMRTRLVSISTIIPRLQRSLRQTCRMTGKQSTLKLLGENTMIDGDILNALVDPLMHILRNAVDHGIENEDERIAKGKPSGGVITFEFDREANNILVRCSDDGRGLDYRSIRLAAEKRGILVPGEIVADEELKKLILRPNFSSRKVSTQTSGRGIGMDVVNTQIVNLGGALALNSTDGGGTTVELRIPLPLSLTYALLTSSGGYRLAIATKGISQIIYSLAGELVIEDQKEMLQMDGNTYPVVRLIDLLNVSDNRDVARPYSTILLVQHDDKTTAVLTEAINDSLDVVIKSMGEYIGKIPGFIGATILGDGTVAPVLDIPELLRNPGIVSSRNHADQPVSEAPTSMLPSVLVVDDSLSQRRALEQLLSDAGYQVRSAHDGIEAAEILAKFKPDLVLTDLEMPRMNGIDFAGHIRAQEKLKSLPIIMITSRATQKHRQMAEKAGVNFYFTKPVREDVLLMKMQDLLEVSVE